MIVDGYEATVKHEPCTLEHVCVSSVCVLHDSCVSTTAVSRPKALSMRNMNGSCRKYMLP